MRGLIGFVGILLLPTNVLAASTTCESVAHLEPPVVDFPSSAEKASLAHCHAWQFLEPEDADTPQDFRRARLCALMDPNADGGEEDLSSGNIVLMQIYANGYGVPRNYDLTAKYACKTDFARERVEIIDTMRTHGGTLNACDGTSGLPYAGLCASYSYWKADAVRARKIRLALSTLTPQARSAYPALQKEVDQYAETHSVNEVDGNGDARLTSGVQDTEVTDDGFASALDDFAHNRLPAATDADLKSADIALNKQYRATFHDISTTVPVDEGFHVWQESPDNLRDTERAWLKYRDAFLHFASIAKPGAPLQALQIALIKERMAHMDTW